MSIAPDIDLQIFMGSSADTTTQPCADLSTFAMLACVAFGLRLFNFMFYQAVPYFYGRY